MVKGVIYYTDFSVSDFILNICQEHLRWGFDGEIVSVSLNRPSDFGKNYVVEGKRGYPVLIKQILLALENSSADYVFFCEHDVLYPPSHFDFVPPRDDIFYYNENVLRWVFMADRAVTYDRMLPLSCLCVNRELALSHYQLRLQAIKEAPVGSFDGRDPYLVRKWGYEPGTKKKKRGGLTDDDFETWHSVEPVIDIRHKKAYSPPKATLESFKHPPVNWREIPIDEIPYWNLKGLFEL